MARFVELEKLLQLVKDEEVKEKFRGLADDEAESVHKTSQTKDKETDPEDKQSNPESKKIVTEVKQSSPDSKKTNAGKKHIKRSVFRGWVVSVFIFC